MKNKWIYDKVNALVKKFKTRNPEELIKNLNVHIKIIPPTQSLLGMYRVILKNRFIFIPENIGSLRTEVLAHELGHDQLHRAECVNGISFHESRVFNFSDRFEIEANIFAAHLLIPDDDVISMMRYAESDRELASELGFDINLLNLKISEMAKMNLLHLDNSQIIKPSADFLKDYKPRDDEWFEY